MQSSVEKILENTPLISLSGQLFCPAAFINDDEEGIAQIEHLIKKHKIGGLTFFHSRASAATNYEKKEVVSYEDSLEKLKKLIARYQAISEIPLLISIDAEWGLAMRVENTPQYPYAITLGALAEEDESLIYDAALQMGKDLKSAGVDFNLAPVVDVNSNPDNPVIGYRSFGESRESVLRKAAQFCKGLSAAGVMNSLKHFPGHGDTAVDSHLGLPVINRSREELMDQDLYPFRHLIERGVDSVMVGHLAVPSLTGDKTLPATLSPGIIKGILREEFGFNGVVISDALNMHSVSKIYSQKGQLELKAFEAGNDILCFSENIAEGKAKILEHCDDEAIRAAVGRILTLKTKAGVFDNLQRTGEPDHNKAREINNRIAKKSIISLKGNNQSPGTLDTLVIIGDHKKEQGFIENLNTSASYTTIKVDEDTSSLTLSGKRNMLLALYVPNIKPLNNFGFSNANLDLLKTLLTKHSCRLILFGNPYALRVIPAAGMATRVVISGQDFPVFQEEAARVINGSAIARGTLPYSWMPGDRK